MPRHGQLIKSSFATDASAVRMDGAVSFDEIAAALNGDIPSPLQALLAHARRVRYGPQDVLYHQGGKNDTVFFITAGLLKLVAHLPNGRTRIVRLHRHGSVLGLRGLPGQDNTHSAVAVTPVTALRLPLEAILRLRVQDAGAYISLAERWHDYLQNADMWITEFSTGPIRGRVARLLAFLSDFEPHAGHGQVQLLTCEEMGSILGVTSESVSRILAEFKRRRILAHNDSELKDFYVADVEQLHHIAKEDND